MPGRDSDIPLVGSSIPFRQARVTKSPIFDIFRNPWLIIPYPMPLDPGKSLGPYEIISPLGAGGMGEVYRARDTRLDRDVAIKILPPQLSADPARRQRFEREAKTISTLNHPNICVLYDVGNPLPVALIRSGGAMARSCTSFLRKTVVVPRFLCRKKGKSAYSERHTAFRRAPACPAPGSV